MSSEKKLFSENSLVIGRLTSLSFNGSLITSADGTSLAHYMQNKQGAPWQGEQCLRYEAKNSSGDLMLSLEGPASSDDSFTIYGVDGAMLGKFCPDSANPAQKASLELATGRTLIFAGGLLTSKFEVTFADGGAVSQHEGGFVHPAVPGQFTRISFEDSVSSEVRQAVLGAQICIEHLKLHSKLTLVSDQRQKSGSLLASFLA